MDSAGVVELPGTRRPRFLDTLAGPVRLELVERFRLEVAGAEVVLPVHAQRVLAYLALARPLRASRTRIVLAERLWPDSPAGRAQASLRTALWRIRQATVRLVDVDRASVQLGREVEVDVHRGLAQAARLLSVAPALPAADDDSRGLEGGLLPDWEDDWLLVERERLRQLQLHALEALARRLLRSERYAAAIDAALAVVAADPLRETARALLVKVHLAEGNLAEAHREVDQYSTLLDAELGVGPSPALVGQLRRAVLTPT